MSHLGQSPSDCTSLLRPEVQWEVFLVLVVLPQILTGLVVHHSQDPCDRLAHGITMKRGIETWIEQRDMTGTYILVSFEGAPPVVFCTRRVSSSFLSSESCLVKSFLDLSCIRMQQVASVGCSLGLELVGLDFTGHFEGSICDQEAVVLVCGVAYASKNCIVYRLHFSRSSGLLCTVVMYFDEIFKLY